MDDDRNQQGEKDSLHPHLPPASRIHEAVDSGISRRGFLGFAAASILLVHAEQRSPRAESRSGIPYRTLGASGEKVSLIGLGGFSLVEDKGLAENISLI